MNKYILCLVIGLILGFVAAFFLQLVEGGEQSISEIGNEKFDEGAIQGTLVDIHQELSKLNEVLINMNETLGHLPGFDFLQTPSSIEHEDITKQLIPSSGPNSSRSKIANTDWINVIDKNLAIALVEMGMTPFDPGVSPLLREAGQKLRDGRRHFDKYVQDLRKRYPRWIITASPSGNDDNIAYHVVYDPAKKQY